MRCGSGSAASSDAAYWRNPLRRIESSEPCRTTLKPRIVNRQCGSEGGSAAMMSMPKRPKQRSWRRASEGFSPICAAIPPTELMITPGRSSFGRKNFFGFTHGACNP